MRTKEISKITAIILSIIIAVMTFGITPSVFAEGDAVAKIGDTEYSTLHEAVENANNGDTIKLISDTYLTSTVNIPQNKSIVLDLNGKAITVQKNGLRSLYAIDNYGTFTLKDSAGNGSITARGIENLEGGKMIIESGKIVACDTNGGAAIWNDGDLTINDGTLEVAYAGSASEDYGIPCLYNDGSYNTTGNAIAQINGGLFKSPNNRAYAIISYGEIVINDATVEGTHGGLSVDCGFAEVNGGTFSATNYYAFWITNNGECSNVTINGGKFSGEKYGLYASVDDGNQDEGSASIVINGGEFSGKTKSAAAINKKNSEQEWSLEIRGGTYSSDVSKYVDTESGYMQYPTEDNRYKVMKEARLSIEPLVQYYRVGESAAINYEILNSNEFFNKDSLIFEKGDANDIKEAEYYDFSMYYDTINNNAITLKGDVVTAVEPGVALVNIGTEGLGGDYVVIVVYDVAPENNQSEADKQASEMLLDAFKNNENTMGLTEEEAIEISYAIIAGKEITTEVVAEPLKEAEKEDAKLVEEKVESGQKLAGYYDISVLVKVNGEEIARLRELGKKIKVELEVPKDLPKVASGYTRTYSVIRVHDGKAEVIAKDLVAEDGKIPVETDKFSTYAVTYTDTVSTNPKTGDTIMIVVAIFTVSVIAITILKKKRK